jgi:diguanylate cyclase (GGDEF)-like protein/PAS domain S-box-containing protein
LNQLHPQSASCGPSDAVTALAITENISVGTYVMAMGPDGPPRFTFVSERWLRMLALQRDAVLADPSLAFQRFHPDELAAFTALHERAAAEKKPLFWEGRILVNGVTSWLRIESISLPDPAGGTIWEGVKVDITRLHQASAELERECALLDTVLSHTNTHVYVKDHQGRYLYANACAQRQLGASLESLRGRTDAELLPAEVAATIRYVDEQVLRLGVPCYCQETLPDPHGDGERVFLSEKRPYRQPGQLDGLIGVSTDITELRRAYQQLDESEEHFRLLAENVSDVVLRLDAEGGILWVSPSLTAALGWLPEEWIGRLGIDFLPHRGQAEHYRENMDNLRAGVTSVRARDEVLARDGSLHWVETQAGPYRNARGEIEGIVSSFRLIDQQVATEKQLQHLATTDGLTGIANRRHLELLLSHALKRAYRTGEALSLILCDIDNFKEVNDQHGHHIGDQVLIDLSRHILQRLRRSDAFGRWGGEEFLVMLPSTGGDDALALAHQLCQQIAPSRFPPVGMVTASFGVAEHLHQDWQDAWLQRVDGALYAAKGAGRNGVRAV